MIQPGQEDTIVAPATAAEGGVAIIRLSGPAAISILDKLFQPGYIRGGSGSLPYRKLVYGTFVHDGEPIDDCLAVIMPGPNSFTGEDVAEIHCHGGRAVTSAVIDACLAVGARLAEPGEFSKRAFLNGRMNLDQAEGLSDLIAAQTSLGRRAALQQLRGGVSSRIRAMRDQLVDAAAEIEAHLDFPEEDIPAIATGRIGGAMRAGLVQIDELLAGFARGRLIREGARVVLAGSPNAGKSSLFNALVGRERALVSPHPGTTRDTIESTIDLNGIALTLVDTAGLRESQDAVEQMGIERTGDELRNADLVLYMIDASAPEGESSVPAEVAAYPHIVVLNKVDQVAGKHLSRIQAAKGDALFVSVAARQGIDAVVARLSIYFAEGNHDETITITRARHAECLRQARQALQRADESFAAGVSGELVMVDLRDALAELGEINGERLDEQILDRIFSTFCLGK